MANKFQKNKTHKFFKSINKNILIISLFILLIFALFDKYSIVSNAYYIIKKDYYSRLSNSYEKLFFSGFCKKESHGYLIYVKKNFPEKVTPSIINFDELRRIPKWIFHEYHSNTSKKKLIVLNYDKYSKELNFDFNLSKYKILDNYQNRCFYLETYE